jgi:hypothetical protein
MQQAGAEPRDKDTFHERRRCHENENKDMEGMETKDNAKRFGGGGGGVNKQNGKYEEINELRTHPRKQ